MPITAQTRRERQKAELRSELVAAAHALVKEEGYEGLTIRKLAKRVGYAPMSVYSYFADKQEILVALAEDVFAQLARRAERNQPAEPLAALRHGMREFAAFGRENPNEYRTIFMTPKPQRHDQETAAELEKNNPALLVDAQVRAGLPGSRPAEGRRARHHHLPVDHHPWRHLGDGHFPQYSFGPRQELCRNRIELALTAVGNRKGPGR